jgi:hypothetical protein
MRKARPGEEMPKKSNQVPRSLVDAVNQNWEIVEQLSSWRFKGANVRDGFFRLTKKGSAKTLMVRYRALYDLGQPYFLEDRP